MAGIRSVGESGRSPRPAPQAQGAALTKPVRAVWGKQGDQETTHPPSRHGGTWGTRSWLVSSCEEPKEDRSGYPCRPDEAGLECQRDKKGFPVRIPHERCKLQTRSDKTTNAVPSSLGLGPGAPTLGSVAATSKLTRGPLNWLPVPPGTSPGASRSGLPGILVRVSH